MDSTPRLIGYPVDQELVRLEARASASRRARREHRADWRHRLLSPWRSRPQTRS